MSSRLSPVLRRALARATAPLASRREGLRILTYHRVNRSHPRDRLTVHPDAFAAQMELLAASGRPVVPLSGVREALLGEAALAPGAVAISFDDGYADNFDVALPILESAGFTATFFLVTGYVGSRDTLDRYRDCCAEDSMLGWEQARGFCERHHELGGHGRSHRELATLEREEARVEIEGCAADIEERTGVRPRSFCYPRGSESRAVRRLVAEAGFDSACTVRPGANRPGCDLLALARTEVSGADELEDFRVKLSGGFDGWHRLVQRAGAWRAPRRR